MARTADEAFRHMEDVASAAGLTLLANLWIGANANYRFRCSVGHEFERCASVVTRGSTACPVCVRAATRQRFFDLLKKRGVVCFESDYLGLTVRHRLQCSQGHCWEAEGRRVMAGRGCASAQVAAMNTHADGLERLREAAAKHGGRCLTDVYSGIVADYEWECANGHRWYARGNNVVRGGWCRICFGLRHSDRIIDPNGLIRLQTAAALQGGECLNSDYEGANSHYRFLCAKGHKWQTAGSHVLSGGWCPRCAEQRRAEANRTPDGLAQLQTAAEAQGGQLLSTDYAGIAAHYSFRCARGHQWETRGERVLAGSWCQRCAGLRRRHTLETMQQTAHERGGRCLSTEYLGVKVRLLWECHRAHVWESSPDSIINGETRCPNCAILDRTKKSHLRLRYDYEGTERGRAGRATANQKAEGK